MSEPDPAAGVYTISVAAELAGVTIRSLRLYERRGLLAPARTTGGTRRFSQDDLHRLRRIAELVADGSTSPGSAKSSTWNRTPTSSAATTPHYEPTTPGSEPRGSTLTTRNGRRRTRNPPGAGHRRGTRPPTGTATNLPDPADPHSVDQRTAHHERHHDHAQTQLDQ